MTPDDVKQLLYDEISKLGKENMQTAINADIAKSSDFIGHLIEECLPEEKRADKIFSATFIEAMLHFMLTISQVPADRKVLIQSTELDLVIPSVRALEKSPEKALVIQILKEDVDLDRANRLNSIQPNRANVWLISPQNVHCQFRNYSLYSDPSLREIIVHIKRFLDNKNVRSPRLFHG